MHKVVLVIVPPDEIENRYNYVENLLLNNSEDQSDGYQMCDWFEIGGRWDGLLSGQAGKNAVPIKALLQIIKQYPKKVDDFCGAEIFDENQELVELYRLDARNGRKPEERHNLKNFIDILKRNKNAHIVNVDCHY